MSFWWARCGWSRGPTELSPFGQTAKNSRKALTSELPPITTDVVWPRGNALRLSSAAKSLSGFGKKSRTVRRDISRAVPETFAMVDGRRARGWSRLTVERHARSAELSRRRRLLSWRRRVTMPRAMTSLHRAHPARRPRIALSLVSSQAPYMIEAAQAACADGRLSRSRRVIEFLHVYYLSKI
jgi:hypothetical protein